VFKVKSAVDFLSPYTYDYAWVSLARCDSRKQLGHVPQGPRKHRRKPQAPPGLPTIFWRARNPAETPAVRVEEGIRSRTAYAPRTQCVYRMATANDVWLLLLPCGYLMSTATFRRFRREIFVFCMMSCSATLSHFWFAKTQTSIAFHSRNEQSLFSLHLSINLY